MKIKATIS